MNRAALTGILIVVYVLIFNLYIYLLSHGSLGQQSRRLWYYSVTFGMTLFCWADLKTLTHEYFHNQFNNIAFGALFANYVLNILNHLGMFNSNGAQQFFLFNGLIFVLTSMILISGGRHGHFETKNG